MESNVITGGIFEYCKTLGVTFNDVLNRKSRNKKSILVQNMYLVLLEKNGYSFEQISRLTNFTQSQVATKLKETRQLIQSSDALAISLYEIVKHITVKNNDIKYAFDGEN